MSDYILLFIVLALVCWVLYAVKILILWRETQNSHQDNSAYFSSVYNDEDTEKNIIVYSDSITDDTITDDINTEEVDLSNIPDNLSIDDDADDNDSNDSTYYQDTEASENNTISGIEG